MGAAKNVTTSSVISFVERLEDESSAFYEALAARHGRWRDEFVGFAESGQRSKRAIVRTYRETVSDALETGFSFQGLDLNEYSIRVRLAEDADFEGVLDQALELEEEAVGFYRDVADRSRSLLATIPMAFGSAAKRREKRKTVLRKMREEGFGEG